jgi:hypothetical protein
VRTVTTSLRGRTITAIVVALLAAACSAQHDAAGPVRHVSGHGHTTPSASTGSAARPDTPATTASPSAPSASPPEAGAHGERPADASGSTTTPTDAAAGPPSTTAPTSPATEPTTPGTRVVDAFGVRATVPAEWPVYDLAAEPTRCVRTDRHAVYLGHAGPTPDCPAQLVGRVETLQIEPLDQQTPDAGLATAAADVNGLAAGLDPAADTTHALVASLPDRHALVTVTFGQDRALAQQVFDSVATGTSAPDVTAQAEPPISCAALGCPNNPGVVFTGLGFDACAAPSMSQMSSWLASPFRAIGIYIGGANRACSQPNLTSSWVSTVLAQGWKLMPLYVGLQAPCASISSSKIDPATAGAQGVAAANDAMNRAAAISIGKQRPITLDMEAYDNTNTSCVSAVRAFVSGWAGQLHQGGYLAGFYSSAASGIADQSAIATNPAYNHLDLIWFAHWNNDASTNEPTKAWLPDNLWTNHQRIHQYRGGQNETFGGVTINIDRDYVDAQVVG